MNTVSTSGLIKWGYLRVPTDGPQWKCFASLITTNSNKPKSSVRCRPRPLLIREAASIMKTVVCRHLSRICHLTLPVQSSAFHFHEKQVWRKVVCLVRLCCFFSQRRAQQKKGWKVHSDDGAVPRRQLGQGQGKCGLNCWVINGKDQL